MLATASFVHISLRGRVMRPLSICVEPARPTSQSSPLSTSHPTLFPLSLSSLSLSHLFLSLPFYISLLILPYDNISRFTFFRSSSKPPLPSAISSLNFPRIPLPSLVDACSSHGTRPLSMQRRASTCFVSIHPSITNVLTSICHSRQAARRATRCTIPKCEMAD